MNLDDNYFIIGIDGGASKTHVFYLLRLEKHLLT